MSLSKWNILFLILKAVQWSRLKCNHYTVVVNVDLELLMEHVALDFLSWRNQSDLPNALHNPTSSLSEEIISFKSRCCLLYKRNVMSQHLKFTYYACWFYSIRSVNICIWQFVWQEINHTQQKSFYVFIPTSMKRINFHPHLQSEDLRTQKAQSLKC